MTAQKACAKSAQRSAVTTPDGNMVGLVAQLGDHNTPATYQALMNHIFSAYIGRFMDIYLDDIIVYSSMLGEHVEHVKLVVDILAREKLYLNRKSFISSPRNCIFGVVSLMTTASEWIRIRLTR